MSEVARQKAKAAMPSGPTSARAGALRGRLSLGASPADALALCPSGRLSDWQWFGRVGLQAGRASPHETSRHALEPPGRASHVGPPQCLVKRARG